MLIIVISGETNKAVLLDIDSSNVLVLFYLIFGPLLA